MLLLTIRFTVKKVSGKTIRHRGTLELAGVWGGEKPGGEKKTNEIFWQEKFLPHTPPNQQKKIRQQNRNRGKRFYILRKKKGRNSSTVKTVFLQGGFSILPGVWEALGNVVG